MNNIFQKNFLLSVVVLFWNNSDKTIKCLDSIFKQTHINFKVILVDNNSELKYQKEIFKWLKQNKIKVLQINKTSDKILASSNKKICYYIKNRINYGCGLGHNFGYKFCLKNNFKYIARIDNDMILSKRLLYNLVNILENNSQIVALTPKVMFAQKPNLIWFRGALIGNNLKLQKQCAAYTPGHKDNKKFRGLVPTDSIVGCASIMRANRLNKVGLSDPDFFYCEEDIELSQRLKKGKNSLVIDLNHKIYHFVSATVGTNWAKNIYYNYKYRLLLIEKIGTPLDKVFGYSICIIKFLLSTVLIFNLKYSSRILQRYYGIKHFYQNKYGKYDRKNYIKINNFFKIINKKTNIMDVISIIFKKRKI